MDDLISTSATGSRGYRTLLSAHRGGCGRSPAVENTLTAFVNAIRMGVEFVEFDIQRSADGVYFCAHDDHVDTPAGRRAVADLPMAEIDFLCGTRARYEEVLALLSEHDRKAHLDLKFTSPERAYADPAATWEVDVVKLARRFLPDEAIVVTTSEDRSVRAVRDWCDNEGISLLIGLSIGRHRLPGMSLWQKACWRVREPFPAARIRACRANLVVAQRHLARWRLISWAARNNLPVLVWTVDGEKEMARLLRDERVWMITSNFPERGLRLRGTHPA